MKIKLKTISLKIFISVFMITYLMFPSYTLADDIEYPEESNTIPINTTNQEIIETSSNKEKKLNLNSRSCILYDRTSKQVLFGKNEYNKVKMASTTKIMTAIVVIEKGDLNRTVEVSKKAANTGGSRLGLKTGDKITIHDLLYGLMLCSGNDAAVALAESTSGSISNFSDLMNKKAQELGLSNSHFESPHGLDSDNHYTTAYELAKLSDYALNNKTFSQIVGTKTYSATINGHIKTLSNTNELLGNLNGIYGIKTGFTNGANRCLVTACKRGDMDIICVVLGADTKKFRTQDSIKLIEYAFENFEYINIEELISKKFEQWKNENLKSFSIYKGLNSDIQLSLSKLDHPIIPIKKGTSNNLNISINANKNLNAPIYKESVIGNISANSDFANIANVNILVTNSIEKKNVFIYLYEFLKDYNNLSFKM